VANVRLHGTTGRVVAEHFAAERASLQPLPAVRFDAFLSVQRRISARSKPPARAGASRWRCRPRG